jgi:hypothetical protein
MKLLSAMALLFFCLSVGLAQAQVLFEDNFDSQPDWSLTQYNLGQHPYGVPYACYSPDYSNCTPLSIWNVYYNGDSHCVDVGGPGHNTLNVNSLSPWGGVGKSFIHWEESCDPYFRSQLEDSDGVLGISLGDYYPEIYLRFYIMFQPGFQWRSIAMSEPEGGYSFKLARVNAHCGVGSFFDGVLNTGRTCNYPTAVSNIGVYGTNFQYASSYRCKNNVWCMGTPSYNADVKGEFSMDWQIPGPWTTTLGDGQWHVMEFYWKMNDPGQYNGRHMYWIDGVLEYDSATRGGIPFYDDGSLGADPEFGWSFVSIGGNNNNRWTENCTGTGCEQWYSIDDVVVSTQYIDPNYVIGNSTPDTTPPAISSVQSSPSSSSATITWITNEASDSQVDYGPTASYGSQSTLNPNLVISHSVQVSGLSPSTLYHYRVRSIDISGNLNVSADYTFTTTAPDTQAPTISITSPTGGAVSGIVTITVTASDNIGVAGVQFMVDGSSIPPEDTTPPYSISWNSRDVANGTHSITATARDTSGNTATSPAVSVTVLNSPVPSGSIASFSFTGSNGDPLGSNWTIATGMTAPVIQDNAARAGTAGANNGAYWNANSFDSDQYAQVRILIAADRYQGVILRHGTNYYTAYVRDASRVRIARYDGGAGTVLTTISTPVANGDTFKAQIIGTNISLYINGAYVGSYNDAGSSITSGFPGITMYGIDATTAVLDDFEAGNAGGTTPPATHPADTDYDGLVCMTELINYIDRWKLNNQDVTISQLINGIGEWKRTSSGC